MIRGFAIVALILCVSVPDATTNAKTTEPTITPAADAELNMLRDAYAKLKSLELAGKITFDTDLMGEQKSSSADTKSAFVAPNRYRCQINSPDENPRDPSLIVSTGQKVFFYLGGSHKYMTSEAHEDRIGFSSLNEEILRALKGWNPSLVLAATADAREELLTDAVAVARVDDETVDGRTFIAIKIERSDHDSILLIDPETHLIRQVRNDLRRRMEKAEMPAVKAALLTFDYSRVTPDADVDATQFAWSPPPGARMARADSPAGAETHALEGKPAPDFSLPNLSDELIRLADLKGSVIVLDFWATWCGPCREGLPHLDKLNGELAGKGVKFFAINLREPKAQAQEFMEESNLTLPVLIDAKGEAGDAYKVQGIPQTVVIGKNGVVRSVIVGFDPDDGEVKLRKIVEAALRE